MPDGVSATDLSRYVFVKVFDPEGHESGVSRMKMTVRFICWEYEHNLVDPELKGYEVRNRDSFVLERTIEIPNPISLVSVIKP